MTVSLRPAAGEALFADPAYVGDWAAVLPGMLSAPQTPPWCNYVVWSGDEPVGMGGFKSPPDEAGQVEMAYLTFLPARRRGIASAVAAELLAIAADAEASTVLAHTLPERSSSTRVLEANGFRRLGEVIDSEDGPVWRWERALACARNASSGDRVELI